MHVHTYNVHICTCVGSIVSINVYGHHYLPSVWPDPEVSGHYIIACTLIYNNDL